MTLQIVQNEAFMQFFWDLASEHDQTRQDAAKGLVEYTEQSENSQYREYAINRLLRGLSSPRECARLGFSVALTAMLQKSSMSVESAVKLLDDHTQVTSSLKGFEERDLLFAKLFGSASIIRSCKFANQEDCMLILERLLDLYDKKQWMQDLTIECILLLLCKISDMHQVSVLSRLKHLVLVPINEMTPNGLLLVVGLQHVIDSSDAISRASATVFGTNKLFDLECIDGIANSLLNSATKFPKIHRIWDYLLGLIVSMNSDRELIPMSKQIDETKNSALLRLVAFIEEHMRASTKEKRALSMKLTVKLAYCLPADYFPLVFSDGFLKSVTSCRAKDHNLLFEYAGGILNEILAVVGNDQEKLVALLYIFSQFNANNFDKASNSLTMKTCIQKLTLDSIQELFRLILSSYSSAEIQSTPTQDATRSVSGAISLFIYISKCCSESIRYNVQELVLILIFHLAFGGSTSSVLEKLEKICKKHKKKNAETSSFVASNSKFLRTILNMGSNFTSEEKALAKPQLMGFCSDLLNDSEHMGSDENNLMQIWISLSALVKLYAIKSNNEDINEMDAAISKAITQLNAEYLSSADNKLRSKYSFASVVVLITAYLRFICDDDADTEILNSFSAGLLSLLSAPLHSSDVEVEEQADLEIFEACTDLLSDCDEAAVRGVREAVKKLWNSIIPLIGDENLSQDFLDTIVDIIVGSVHSERENDDDDDDNIDVSDGEDNEDSIPTLDIELDTSKFNIEENEEEIILGADALFDVLGDETSEGEQEIVHTQEADEALAKMLHARQEIRKRGQLQLLSQQILLKSRILDIFECLVSRLKSGNLAFGFFLPLLQGFRKTFKSKLIQSIPVGKSFTQRLLGVIQQLCKKKLSLKLDGDETLSNDCAEELQELLPFLVKQFHTKDALMKAIAEETLMSVTRMVLHSESVASKQLIVAFFIDATTNFCVRRRHGIPVQLIEDAVSQRFPTYFIPSIWPVIIEGLKDCTILYNQSSICDLIAAVLKKFGSFDETCKSILRDSSITILNLLCNIAQSWVSPSTKHTDLSSKRVKPLLDLMKFMFSSQSLVIFEQPECQKSIDACKSVLNSLKSQNESLTKSIDLVLNTIDQSDSKNENKDNNRKRQHEESNDSKRNKRKK